MDKQRLTYWWGDLWAALINLSAEEFFNHFRLDLILERICFGVKSRLTTEEAAITFVSLKKFEQSRAMTSRHHRLQAKFDN